MNRRRGIAILVALGLASALAWTSVGGVTVAQGQEEPVTINRAHEGSHRPSFDRPIFILALGSDTGSPKYKRGGTMQRGRADAIQIIAVEPKLKKASIVGIPRDSYVPVTCGGTTKINAGMFFGGPDCMVSTVEQLVKRAGGPSTFAFDYYLVGGFEHFANMVNDLGGIPVDVPYRMDDSASRADLRPGPQTLRGDQALAMARNRKDAPRGDFSRSENQGLLMLGGLTKARTLAAKDPSKTLDFLRSIFRNVKTDFSVVEAFRLGLALLQIDPKDVTSLVLPGTTGTTPAGSSVLLGQPAFRVLADVADDGVLGSSG